MSTTMPDTAGAATKTMTAIQKPAPEEGFKVIQAPVPEPGPDEVLIKIKLASVCGTDFHITNWDEWSAARIKPPLIYGHEFCGHIEKTGENVTHLKPGEYVSAEMHLVCGECHQCQRGNFHICEQSQIFGIDRDGCYAQFMKIPAKQVVKLPVTIPFEYGAFLDSLGNAVHAVSKVMVINRDVHVVGCGPVGLFSIAVAKALGAKRVFASDVSDFRLDLAQKAGADRVLKADETKVSDELLKLTDNNGVDVVLEMSGSPLAIKDAFRSMTKGGTMVMMGIPKKPVEINLPEAIIFTEARVIGCNGRQIWETWDLMLDLLVKNQLNLDFIITHKLPLSEFGKAMDLIREGQSGKIILDPQA